ncbi:MAG: pyocin, partial [Pseudomonas sp.]
FWRAVAADEELSQQFNSSNVVKMRNGVAPRAITSEVIGGRGTFELHHHIRVTDGGDVYGMDNLFVLTPRRHIKLHGAKNND